jgi:uncharacterized protein YjbJ (UPF0337 family)/ElaB/YqjD/DUF883 family membrane-anchored ribosome-binding protein
MITREELKGRWNEIRGRIKEKWGVLTDDELHQVEGNADQLIGLIQRKTGEGREQITKFFDSITEGGNGGQMGERVQQTVQQASETAQRYAHEAQRYMQDGYQQASRQVQDQMHQAEQMVRTRPVESLAAAFGAGLVTGVLVALVMRTR